MITRDQVRALQTQFEMQVVDEILNHPGKNYRPIAVTYGLSTTRVAQIAVKYGVQRPRGRKPAAE